jgi:hypothetical protein
MYRAVTKVNKNQVNESGFRKLYLNILVVLVFSSLMLTAIVMLYRSEPDIHSQLMKEFAAQLARSATNAHWQWQAEGKPAMIMLVHFDDQGNEVGRRPVKMAHFGWPAVAPSRAGCMQLWSQLINEANRLDGFRIIGDYYAASNEDEAIPNARCRFKVSSGPYFDYAIYTGQVTNQGE